MQGEAPEKAAQFASKATAYYCETQGFGTGAQLAAFQPPEVTVSTAVQAGAERKVYLAGPFFHLAQVWMIEELRTQLRGAGLTVFSPYHDVGLGSAADVVDKDIQAIKECDVMLAVADGLDAGTMFEVGYARSLEMPVVVYSELEKGAEALKMMEGTGCLLCSNLATAVYTTLWEAVKN
jgi:nucleoside 2-deoxyribosyltransferase